MSETPVPTLGPNRAREETARKWRKRRSRLRRRLRRAGDLALAALAVFAVLFGIHQAHHGGGRSPATTAIPGSVDARFPPMNDVKLTGCGYAPKYFGAAVTLKIQNNTPTTWTYYIDVRWKEASQKYADKLLHSKPVKAHQQLAFGGFGFAQNRRTPSHLTCTIVSVNRAPT